MKTHEPNLGRTTLAAWTFPIVLLTASAAPASQVQPAAQVRASWTDDADLALVELALEPVARRTRPKTGSLLPERDAQFPASWKRHSTPDWFAESIIDGHRVGAAIRLPSHSGRPSSIVNLDGGELVEQSGGALAPPSWTVALGPYAGEQIGPYMFCGNGATAPAESPPIVFNHGSLLTTNGSFGCVYRVDPMTGAVLAKLDAPWEFEPYTEYAHGGRSTLTRFGTHGLPTDTRAYDEARVSFDEHHRGNVTALFPLDDGRTLALVSRWRRVAPHATRDISNLEERSRTLRRPTTYLLLLNETLQPMDRLTLPHAVHEDFHHQVEGTLVLGLKNGGMLGVRLPQSPTEDAQQNLEIAWLTTPPRSGSAKGRIGPIRRIESHWRQGALHAPAGAHVFQCAHRWLTLVDSAYEWNAAIDRYDVRTGQRQRLRINVPVQLENPNAESVQQHDMPALSHLSVPGDLQIEFHLQQPLAARPRRFALRLRD